MCFAPGGAHTHRKTAHTLQRALGTVSLTTRMGCNLCTLQKREEHYKLLYEIAQVSGNHLHTNLMTAEAAVIMSARTMEEVMREKGLTRSHFEDDSRQVECGKTRRKMGEGT